MGRPSCASNNYSRKSLAIICRLLSTSHPIVQTGKDSLSMENGNQLLHFQTIQLPLKSQDCQQFDPYKTTKKQKIATIGKIEIEP